MTPMTRWATGLAAAAVLMATAACQDLSLIHISEPTRH